MAKSYIVKNVYGFSSCMPVCLLAIRANLVCLRRCGGPALNLYLSIDVLQLLLHSAG